jgi:hypothetical protein
MALLKINPPLLMKLKLMLSHLNQQENHTELCPKLKKLKTVTSQERKG